MLVCGIVGTQLLVRLKAELGQRALGLLFLGFVGMRGTQAYAARARRLLERTASVSSPGSALPIADVDNDPPAVSGAHDDLDDESLQEGDLNVSRVSADGRTRVQALAAVLAGALSGLFGGWFAVAGPPFMIYFTQFHASKGAMRASFIFHALLLNVPTMPALIHAGLVNGELWPQYAAQLIGLTSGGLLGLWLHAKVSAHAVMAGVLGLLFASSAVMLSAGDHAGALRIATACALAAGLAVSAGEACVACLLWRRRARRASRSHGVGKDACGTPAHGQSMRLGAVEDGVQLEQPVLPSGMKRVPPALPCTAMLPVPPAPDDGAMAVRLPGDGFFCETGG